MHTVGDTCLGGSVSVGGKLLVLPILNLLRLVSTAMSDGMSVLTRGPNWRTNESWLWLDVIGDAGLASIVYDPAYDEGSRIGLQEATSPSTQGVQSVYKNCIVSPATQLQSKEKTQVLRSLFTTAKTR